MLIYAGTDYNLPDYNKLLACNRADYTHGPWSSLGVTIRSMKQHSADERNCRLQSILQSYDHCKPSQSSKSFTKKLDNEKTQKSNSCVMI